MKRTVTIKNWIFKAKNDVQTAKDLYKNSHYDWCLFIWHLAIEKALKAKITSLKKQYLFTHNLIKLAELAELKITDKEKEQLREITTYNIEARYDDDKLAFYKKTNKKYTDIWIKICERFYQLIIKSI